VVKRRPLKKAMEDCLAQAVALAAAEEPLVGLWLFGSQAQGRATPLSDVDLAYLTRESLPDAEREALGARLYRNLSRLFGSDEITLVDLATAPPLLAFRVLSQGKNLYCRRRQPLERWVEAVLRSYPEAHRLRRNALQEGRERTENQAMAIDREKVEEQLWSLGRDLRKLREATGKSRTDYLADEDAQIIVERKFQTATEACLNIGNHLIAALGLDLAEDYASVFQSLGRAGILSPELAEAMADMARFRNLLVHLYWRVDHAQIYDRLPDRLRALEGFREEIRRFLEGPSQEVEKA
jgi:uncharacterized protein YutE (UPF0331/DUF86 family)/predicted nucleotidyltransferase